MPVAPQLFQGCCVPVYGTYKRSTFAYPCQSCRTFRFWTLALLLMPTLPVSAGMRHFLLLSTLSFPITQLESDIHCWANVVDLHHILYALVKPHILF